MTDDGDNEEIINWSFDVGHDYPSVEVVDVIAEIEGQNSSEMPAIYDTIGQLIEDLFSDPPSPDAEAVLQFSYEGYRITLDQDGHATFREVTGKG